MTTSKRTTRRRRLGLFTAALALSSAVAFVLWEPAMQAAGDWLVVQDPLQPADVIHVISGPDYRADYAIQLYLAGYGKQLFFTGGWCPEIQGIHAERGKERALAQGVPLAAIAADGTEVNSTYSEAVRLKAFIDQSEQPIRSVIIVSDPHHMRRSRWAYQRVLGDDVQLLMEPVPFADSPYQRAWWQDAVSERMVKDEYTKFAYYLLRYQFTWGVVQEWLASLDQD